MNNPPKPLRRQLTLSESLNRHLKAPRVEICETKGKMTDANEHPTDIFSNPRFKWMNAKSEPTVPVSCRPEGSAYIHTNLQTTNGSSGTASDKTVGTDAWNASYVKLPCSSRNLYHENGNFVLRWSLIVKALSQPITSVEEFKTAVHSYNNRFVDSWKFEHLEAALKIKPEYKPLLPQIAELALRLPRLFTKPIPLLLRNKEESISLSRIQIACLLANAFYCTFPHRNSRSRDSEYANFPLINFGVFMSKGFRNTTKSTDHKVLCILHYFHRIFSDPAPSGTVTYTRRCLNAPPDFASSEVQFNSIAFGVSSTCLIEDAHPDTIQVDFANRFLGGGVLRGGCVQEEILCCIRPELLAGLLFCEAMEDHEALIIEGAERFSTYTGYSSSFKWTGDFNETTDAKNSKNEEGQWMGAICAIDATPFRSRASQIEPSSINRELAKAYCGFSDGLAPYHRLPSVVVSGNWGCGAFGGNRELKCLIQLMACAQAGKSLAYSTFNDAEFAEKALHMYEALCSSSCTVGQLWKIISSLNLPEGAQRTVPVFEFVITRLF